MSFASIQAQIAQKGGVSLKEAGAIVAAQKKNNTNLKKVK